MAVSLEQFIKQLQDSGILAEDTLQAFLPPNASPTSAEQLARELILQKKLTKFQAEEASKGKGRSLVLGNYVLLEKIGAGGMGQVFKARHRRMDRLVAVKLLPRAMTKDQAAIARFDREVKAAAKLRHTNIVAADDADEANGVHFLVMELVEGSDLSALVKKNGPFSVDKSLACIIQAARGLEYAHEHGVIHRDIKPANLLMDARGTVKILDMGLARIEGATAGQAELTSTGAIMGTVDYMAPEQALNTKTADARSDIYSLGISLWYLLTGKCAYDGDTLMAKLLAHRDAITPSLSQARPEVPAAVDAVFQKMIAKQAKDRHQTMTAVILDLESCRSLTSFRRELDGVAVPPADGHPTATSQINLGGPSTIPQSQIEVRPQQKSKTVTVDSADPGATFIVNDAVPPADSQTVIAARSIPGRQGPRKAKSKTVPTAWWQDRRAQFGGAAATVIILLVAFLLQPPNRKLQATSDGKDQTQKQIATPAGSRDLVDNQRGASAPAIAPVNAGPLPQDFSNGIGMEFVKVPKGTGWLGGADGKPGERMVEFPSDFYLGKYEVTQSEWEALMNENPSMCSRTGAWKERVTDILDADLKRFPVENVSWFDCQKFLERLNQQAAESGWVYRLPKSDEWEYACRGGSLATMSERGMDYFFDKPLVYGPQVIGKGNYCAIGGPPGLERTTRVGSYLPNRLGLFDMHGNVWECCDDEAKVPAGTYHLSRGAGFWYDTIEKGRASASFPTPPEVRNETFGFRVARVPVPPTTK